MVSKKLEYDSSMGGTVVLGTHLPTYKYAASALNELKELVTANSCSYSNKLVFQSLPKHMRRRAMSHHPKRLPRKYRAAHIHQMSKSGKPQATKKPSRKHRRRPQNLLRDYLRRQRKHKWLETHIWHAKRFHMIEKWGYKLPYASCDKTYRACYRASTKHCLLQDLSFYACVQMIGTVEELAKGFQRLTSKECGLSIVAKTFLTGRREGCVDLFKDGEYPYKALGKVTFLWRCEDDELKNNCKRTIWLWIHPSAYITVLEEFIKVFDLKKQMITKVPLENLLETREESEKMKADTMNSLPKKKAETSKKFRTKYQRRLQFMTKHSTRLNTPLYKNNNETIELRELRDTLNRFRLTGPLAQSILQRAFQIKDLTSQPNCWITEAIENKTNFLNCHQNQQEFWEKCHKFITSPGELLSNMVIALNIDDPRLHRPQKRSKAITVLKSENLFNSHDLLADIKPLLSSSPLWLENIRNRVSSEMLSSHEYCSLRAKHVIVPGKPCKFEDYMQPVPVLLIQRPGSQDSDYKRLGYGCGWDIIAPAGYGMPIWLSLIMWGARPGGLREFDSIARELGTEEHLPDTVGGLQASGDRYNELHSKYFRLPPNKRCNYRKFSIVSPFRVPFVQLIRDWHSSQPLTISNNNAQPKTMFILRDRQKLQDLAECVKKCNLYKFPQNLPSQCLVQIKSTMKSRGNPKDFSVICLPIKKDLKRNLKQIKLNNQDPVYVEPLLSDPNEKERNQLRLQHKKLLKRLRARRVREKRKKQETSNTKVYIRSAETSAICLEQFKKMSKLWLHEDTSTVFSVRKQGTRDCFGYVSSAHFCLTEGTVGCIGYVTVEGLKQLLKLGQQFHLKHPLFLIRSTNSRNYRFAQLKINLQV